MREGSVCEALPNEEEAGRTVATVLCQNPQAKRILVIGSGLAMAESLRVVADTTGNSLMKRAIQQARERILAGADIATPLRESGVIDPAIAHMVAVGEKSGELETMLRSVSENLESSTDVVIERLSAAVEPLIIIIMAAVIGVIAYATILPILRISAVKM